MDCTKVEEMLKKAELSKNERTAALLHLGLEVPEDDKKIFLLLHPVLQNRWTLLALSKLKLDG